MRQESEGSVSKEQRILSNYGANAAAQKLFSKTEEAVEKGSEDTEAAVF